MWLFDKIVDWFTGGDDEFVKVVKGDSLWRIAEDITGDGMNWVKLAEANPEKHWTRDYIIQPGEMLRLPKDWRD